MKKFKAAIFDMDGTLLDSMYIWRYLSYEYLKRNNIEMPEDKDPKAIIGLWHAVDFLLENFDFKFSREEMHQKLLDVLADFYRNEAVFKPGAAEFLQELRRRNIPTLLFSATPQHLLHIVLKRLDAEQYFSHGILSCDTIGHTKHEEEAFFAATRHLGVEADEVMIFEDALYAARTAKKAGFTLGIISDREEHHEETMRELADFYVEKDWAEFPVDRFF